MSDHLLLQALPANMVNYGEQASFRAAPLMWNSLPLATSNSPSSQILKSLCYSVLSFSNLCFGSSMYKLYLLPATMSGNMGIVNKTDC